MTARPAWAQSAAPHRRRAPVNDPLNPIEHVEQCRVAEYLNLRPDLRDYWCHVPNGELRSAATGGKLKAAGVKAGVPDILIFWPTNGRAAGNCVGLAIELKRLRGGVASAAQAAWAGHLAECGWRWDLCRGADAAIKVIEECYGKPRAVVTRGWCGVIDSYPKGTTPLCDVIYEGKARVA